MKKRKEKKGGVTEEKTNTATSYKVKFTIKLNKCFYNTESDPNLELV